MNSFVNLKKSLICETTSYLYFQVQSLPIMKNPWQVYRRAGQTINKHNRLNSDWARRHINDKYVRQSLKGQLISECLFDFLNFPKKPTENFDNFLP